MLDEHPDEALDGAELGRMNHHRLLFGVLGRGVFETEAVRQREVDLDRRHLPAPADGVAQVHVDLRSVEGTLALGDLIGHLGGLERITQRVGGEVPQLGLPNPLLLGTG